MSRDYHIGDGRLDLWTPSFSRAFPHVPLIEWFDQQLVRMHDDLARHQYFDMPAVRRAATDTATAARRSRLFDALFSAADDEGAAVTPTFRTNAAANQIECSLATGCGDFFRPEDVEVNLNGRTLEFKARREQKSECGNSYVLREVRRVVTVPENADADQLNAELSPGGQLVITAPLLRPAIEEGQQPSGDRSIAIKINRS